MATKRTKIIVSKHFLASFKLSTAGLVVEYIVEAKLERRWVRVGGPFADESTANDFASQYSASHPNVEGQVVIFQS